LSQNGIKTKTISFSKTKISLPVMVLVGGDGQDARAIHGSSRSVTVHPSAFVLNGPIKLVVVATLG